MGGKPSAAGPEEPAPSSGAARYRDAVLPTAATTQSRYKERSLIVAIGIDRYDKWPHLRNAVSDARGMLDVFSKLTFESVVEPLFDEAATADALRSLVSDELPRKLVESDRLVVFFAGHGHTRIDTLPDGDVAKTGYIIPFDGDSEGSTVRWLRLDSWLSDIARLPVRHILVILDACYSGIALDSIVRWRGANRIASTALRQLSSRRSRRVITSALDDQKALDAFSSVGVIESQVTACMWCVLPARSFQQLRRAQ